MCMTPKIIIIEKKQRSREDEHSIVAEKAEYQISRLGLKKGFHYLHMPRPESESFYRTQKLKF